MRASRQREDTWNICKVIFLGKKMSKKKLQENQGLVLL